MKGDFSRYRFDPAKHYTAVLEQQGRVQLDADANEQRAIDCAPARHRDDRRDRHHRRAEARRRLRHLAASPDNASLLIGAGPLLCRRPALRGRDADRLHAAALADRTAARHRRDAGRPARRTERARSRSGSRRGSGWSRRSTIPASRIRRSARPTRRFGCRRSGGSWPRRSAPRRRPGQAGLAAGGAGSAPVDRCLPACHAIDRARRGRRRRPTALAGADRRGHDQRCASRPPSLRCTATAAAARSRSCRACPPTRPRASPPRWTAIGSLGAGADGRGLLRRDARARRCAAARRDDGDAPTTRPTWGRACPRRRRRIAAWRTSSTASRCTRAARSPRRRSSGRATTVRCSRASPM